FLILHPVNGAVVVDGVNLRRVRRLEQLGARLVQDVAGKRHRSQLGGRNDRDGREVLEPAVEQGLAVEDVALAVAGGEVHRRRVAGLHQVTGEGRGGGAVLHDHAGRGELEGLVARRAFDPCDVAVLYGDLRGFDGRRDDDA